MASSRPAKQGVRENAGSSALLDASWLLGLAIWRAQLESLCAATLRDLLLCRAGTGAVTWAVWRAAMTRWACGGAGHDRLRVVSRCGPAYQIRTRVAGSSHSSSAAPTSNAP